MKITDIARGTKILVPCVSCGYKRSVIFKSKATYEEQKKKQCKPCANANRDYDGMFYGNRNATHGGNPSFEDMD